MRFLIAPAFNDELKQANNLSQDCFVRPCEYAHHLYVEGVKYIVVDALYECIEKAKAANDVEALRHLELHQSHLDALGGAKAIEEARADGADVVGDPPPPLDDEEGEEETPIATVDGYVPPSPKLVSETGLHVS